MSEKAANMTQDEGDDDGEPFEQAMDYALWWASKYKETTVVGIFAALSVYLSQFLNQSRNIGAQESIFIEIGIAGALLIFIILTLQLILGALEQAIKGLYHLDLTFFLYILTSVGLVGLVMGVVAVMSRFSKGTEPIIDVGLSISIFAGYLGYLYVNNPLTRFEDYGVLGQMMTYSPVISIIWMVASILWDLFQGEQTLLDTAFNQEITSVGIISLISTHGILTLIILLVLAIPIFGMSLYERILKIWEDKESG